MSIQAYADQYAAMEWCWAGRASSWSFTEDDRGGGRRYNTGYDQSDNSLMQGHEQNDRRLFESFLPVRKLM